MSITPFDQAEINLKSAQGFAYFVQWMSVYWARGNADVTRGGTVELANGLVPGWKPESVEEYLARL